MIFLKDHNYNGKEYKVNDAVDIKDEEVLKRLSKIGVIGRAKASTTTSTGGKK